jgi:hypothetical protein
MGTCTTPRRQGIKTPSPSGSAAETLLAAVHCATAEELVIWEVKAATTRRMLRMLEGRESEKLSRDGTASPSCQVGLESVSLSRAHQTWKVLLESEVALVLQRDHCCTTRSVS